MEGYREFTFFRGRVRFRQPNYYRLSVVELLFLANLKGIRKSSKVVDLGSGFGALSLLIALKYGCQVWAVERDPHMLQLLSYNTRANGLEDKVRPVELDIRHVDKVFRPQYFDVVVANPPFYRGGQKKDGYRHEKDTTLEDFLKSTGFLLRDGGSLNLLIASNRLIEAIFHMKNHNINVASLRFFYPTLKKNGKIVRIHALKNLNPDQVVEKPLIINEEKGGYTQEVRSILEGFL
ncbi:MAG: methyltransferase [Aquificaceae bacterium]|nr:methyltransferase [Aquificaceae bacterium]